MSKSIRPTYVNMSSALVYYRKCTFSWASFERGRTKSINKCCRIPEMSHSGERDIGLRFGSNNIAESKRVSYRVCSRYSRQMMTHDQWADPNSKVFWRAKAKTLSKLRHIPPYTSQRFGGNNNEHKIQTDRVIDFTKGKKKNYNVSHAHTYIHIHYYVISIVVL